MQRLLFIIFTSFFFLLSCAKQKPKGVLSEDKMTKILTEASLIDAYLNTLPIDSGRKVMLVLYDNLFKEFDIDSTIYKQNITYYFGNPKLTEKLYTDVNIKLIEYDRVLHKEDSIRNVFVQDSINRASRLQQLHAERYGLTTNYYRDSSDYSYKSDGLTFLSKANLHVNAYGIQVPAITTWTSGTNSSARQRLNTKDYILNSRLDSAEYVYKLNSLAFLEQTNLSLNAYGIQVPVVSSGFTMHPSTTPPMGLQSDPEPVLEEELPISDENIPVEESRRNGPMAPIKEKIIKKDLLKQDLPKKLQIQKQ